MDAAANGGAVAGAGGMELRGVPSVEELRRVEELTQGLLPIVNSYTVNLDTNPDSTVGQTQQKEVADEVYDAMLEVVAREYRVPNLRSVLQATKGLNNRKYIMLPKVPDNAWNFGWNGFSIDVTRLGLNEKDAREMPGDGDDRLFTWSASMPTRISPWRPNFVIQGCYDMLVDGRIDFSHPCPANVRVYIHADLEVIEPAIQAASTSRQLALRYARWMSRMLSIKPMILAAVRQKQRVNYEVAKQSEIARLNSGRLLVTDEGQRVTREQAIRDGSVAAARLKLGFLPTHKELQHQAFEPEGTTLKRKLEERGMTMPKGIPVSAAYTPYTNYLNALLMECTRTAIENAGANENVHAAIYGTKAARLAGDYTPAAAHIAVYHRIPEDERVNRLVSPARIRELNEDSQARTEYHRTRGRG